MATKTPTKTPAKSPAPPVKKVINMEPLKKANVPIIFIVGGNFVLIEMGILWGNWGGRSKQRWKEISSFSFQGDKCKMMLYHFQLCIFFNFTSNTS